MHVLLVEDDEPVAESLRRGLKRYGFEVDWVTTGAAALAHSAPHDVVLLDLGLPDTDGLDVCKALRERGDVPIIVISARSDETDRVVGLELGADDYVTKPFGVREVIARIRAVMRRVRPALAGEALSYAGIEMDTVGHKVRRGCEVISLGPTEFRLLKHFLEHPGWVFSRERLLDAVWGHDSDIESRTVDVHIRRLRKAINVGDKPDIIRTVRSAGYALDSGN